MNDVVLVHVVHAGQHLLDQYCGVPLAELASCKNLVKEFTALANLGDKVVALFVFEKLVHLNDVWVVLQVLLGIRAYNLLLFCCWRRLGTYDFF